MTIIGTSVLEREPGVTAVAAPYGPRGPVIMGTSSASITIGLGETTFQMNEYGLGFAPGIRLRATALDAVDHWMEGVATGYTGSELTIQVDLFSGTGAHDTWQINVAGEQGIQGPAGPQGTPGAIPEAPMDSLRYVRFNGAWSSITGMFQPLDGDLTALAALSGVDTIYYRSGTSTWTPVTIGSGISFAGGVLAAAAGGGNVSNSGTPVAGQLAQWIDNQRIQGVDLSATFAPIASPIFTGNPQAPTPAAGDADTSIATTGFVNSSLALFAMSCGRLDWVSATALKFAPYNGAILKINGAHVLIPAAGIAGLGNTNVFVNGTAGQNLAANTRYYVYAFLNALAGGAVTADYSTTGHSRSSSGANTGTEIKTGDETRSLIGMVYTNASGQFTNSAAARFVLSWFNRRNLSLQGATTAGAQTNSGTPIELNAAARISFLTWGEEEVFAGMYGTVLGFQPNEINSVFIGCEAGVLNGQGNSHSMYAPSVYMSAGLAVASGFAEGQHFISPFASCGGGVGTYYIGVCAIIRG